MTKVTSFAGLALLALLVLAGCGEVRKCKRGTPGCVGAAPENGECAAGLEKKNGKCVEPEGGGSSGCNCAIDEVCDLATRSCLAYCEPVDVLPETRPTPPSCKPVITASDPNPAPFTFRELCAKTCLQNCVRAEAFCPGYVCNPADCEKPDALARCVVACPGMDPTCMENRCSDQGATACTDFTCPGTLTRDCQGIRCLDSCGDNVKDGFCDDGDPKSASYNFCQYGNDCTDCGPRRGTTRPARIALGEPCPGGQDVSCEGYNDDFLKTKAWCFRFVSGGPYRCVPSCTTEDGEGECDDGYECQAVLNSENQPYRDATSNRTAGYVCVPNICQ